MASIFDTATSKALKPNSLNVAGVVEGVEEEDMPVIRQLIKTWRKHWPMNLIRSSYYFAGYRLKDFGISIPPSIKSQVHACIGWPAKAVRSLADIEMFEGFDMQTDTMDVATLADGLGLETIVPEAIVSAYTHGCAFITLTADDDGGLVAVPRSAEYCAALWDGARNRLRAVLTINDASESGNIRNWNVFLPGRVYQIRRHDGQWEAVKTETHWPEPMAIPIVSDPQLSRPLGRARITRTLMSLTDMGFRTYVRMEASAEFYSVPKLWFLGASKEAFDKDTWSNLVSAINGIDADEETGEKPELKQVTQSSMTPHVDMLKSIAMSVAAETNLPVDSLGITLTNPSSAEAMAAAERRLTREADRQNRIFGAQLERLIRMAVCLRDGIAYEDMPEELRHVHAVWAPTREVSEGARSDFYVKVSQVNPAYATSTVGLRRLGLDADEIRLLQAANASANGRGILDLLMKTNTQTIANGSVTNAVDNDQ